jgi:hypothetical protein
MDRKRGAFMDNRLGWEAFMGSRTSSLFALVRECKDSFGSRELRFSHRIPLLGLVWVLARTLPYSPPHFP